MPLSTDLLNPCATSEKLLMNWVRSSAPDRHDSLRHSVIDHGADDFALSWRSMWHSRTTSNDFAVGIVDHCRRLVNFLERRPPNAVFRIASSIQNTNGFSPDQAPVPLGPSLAPS